MPAYEIGTAVRWRYRVFDREEYADGYITGYPASGRCDVHDSTACGPFYLAEMNAGTSGTAAGTGHFAHHELTPLTVEAVPANG